MALMDALCGEFQRLFSGKPTRKKRQK